MCVVSSMNKELVERKVAKGARYYCVLVMWEKAVVRVVWVVDFVWVVVWVQRKEGLWRR